MRDRMKEKIAKCELGFWKYVFILIILFWKDPDIIDGIIYWLTK